MSRQIAWWLSNIIQYCMYLKKKEYKYFYVSFLKNNGLFLGLKHTSGKRFMQIHREIVIPT